MPVLAALLTKGNKMAEKIEGYRKRDSEYVPLSPKETTVDIKATTPKEGPFMTDFRKSIEEHMQEISSGRGNGIPDNYQEKKVK
jgi:hypothetical protein